MNRNRINQRRILATIVLAICGMLISGNGCPPPDGGNSNGDGDTNQAPVANAGANQSVAVNEAVTLNGSASSDPDGDSLTFTWTQTSGTVVALNDANTATPSFIAPAAATTLSFQLTASDGQASDSDTVEVGVDMAVTQTPILLVANFNNNSVTAYDITDPSAVNGNIAPGANLSGAQTLLQNPSDIVVDADGSLLVSNFNLASVTTYADADDLTGINGNVTPTGNVQGAATLLTQPTTLSILPASDLLFVADIGNDVILVFDQVSTGMFNGNRAPIRTIASADIDNPFGINFGAADTLYVANNGAPRVVVFESASTLNGAVAATRIITSGSFGSLFDVFVDDGDRMFVVDQGNGQVHVFDNASTLNGNVAPDVTLTVTGAAALTAIAVDSGGVGYIVDNVANAVYSYDNMANRNGAVAPDRILQGTNTQLVGPIRVFLLE